MYLLKQLTTCISLPRAARFVHFDHLGRDAYWRAELDDCARTKLVRVEIGETDGYELDVQGGISGHGAESHDREAGLEGEEVCPIVRAA